MTITRRITFKLYPNKTQVQKLHYFRKLHKLLYNASLSNRKVQYQRFGKKVTYFEQQNSLPEFKKYWPEFIELGSQALQATVKRVDFAFQRFFAGLGGYPRFKSSRNYRGWTYPAKSGWKAHTTGDHGGLELKNIPGQIRMRGKARTWGNPNTCTIIWKASINEWFASITVKCEPTRELGKGALGIDFGTMTAAALSDGTKIDNPQFLKNGLDKIRKVSKQLKRKRKPQKLKVKASKRWKKAKKQIAKLHNKIGNKRQDWCHKVAVQITSDNSMIATEKLNLKGMTRKAKKRTDSEEVSSELGRSKQGKRRRQKTGLNRSLLDVGIGKLKSCIKYKIEEGKGLYIEIPTKKAKPSQTCPNCGKQKKKTLSERTHNCGSCGYQEDRDVAAAQVMINYAWGMERASINVERTALLETPKSKYCGGFKQLSARKRQKPRSS